MAETMEDALLGNIGDYLKIQGGGSWNPLYTKDDDGVRQRGFNFSGGAQARIPLDPIIEDAMLRLSVGGYRYGGDVKLPQAMQEMGAPSYIDYGDTGLSNLGIGMSKGGFSVDLGYNRGAEDKFIKSIMARYKVDF